MANNYLVLGQANPVAATVTTLYTVPAATETTVSTLVICNRSTIASKIRVAIRVAGAVLSDEQYIYYDLEIPGNETFASTIGITLETTDVVSVYTENATVSFNLFGTEIT